MKIRQGFVSNSSSSSFVVVSSDKDTAKEDFVKYLIKVKAKQEEVAMLLRDLFTHPYHELKLVNEDGEYIVLSGSSFNIAETLDEFLTEYAMEHPIHYIHKHPIPEDTELKFISLTEFSQSSEEDTTEDDMKYIFGDPKWISDNTFICYLSNR